MCQKTFFLSYHITYPNVDDKHGNEASLNVILTWIEPYQIYV